MEADLHRRDHATWLDTGGGEERTWRRDCNVCVYSLRCVLLNLYAPSLNDGRYAYISVQVGRDDGRL